MKKLKFRLFLYSFCCTLCSRQCTPNLQRKWKKIRISETNFSKHFSELFTCIHLWCFLTYFSVFRSWGDSDSLLQHVCLNSSPLFCPILYTVDSDNYSARLLTIFCWGTVHKKFIGTVPRTSKWNLRCAIEIWRNF